MSRKITVNDGQLIARLNENINKPKTEKPVKEENKIRDCVPSTRRDEYKENFIVNLKKKCQENGALESKANEENKTEKALKTLSELMKEFKTPVIQPDNTEEDGAKPSYEHVNHPSHYNNYDVEVVEMMRRIWGDEATALWCKMTAYKYRMRMGTKPDNDILQDLAKEQWYLKKSKELCNDK